MVEREIRGWSLRYAAYPIDGLNVWGMTAFVLGGLGALARPRRGLTRRSVTTRVVRRRQSGSRSVGGAFLVLVRRGGGPRPEPALALRGAGPRGGGACRIRPARARPGRPR